MAGKFMKDFYYEGRRENHPTRLFIYNDAYHFLLPDIYSCYLKKIKGIRFTRREIDIIAFLISGRSTKKIAAFLSLSPKTVANHTQNIMVKLGCNSRDAIIDFVERSDRFLFLKKYYSTLLSDAEFEKSLKKISILKDKAPPLCAIAYLQEHPPQSSLLHYLETHLRLAGVAVSREARENNKTFYQLTQEPYNDAYVIYIICGMLPKSLQTGTETESALHLEEVTQFPTNKIFLFSEKKNLDAIPKCLTGIIDYIDLREEKNYYYLVFEILKIFLPNFNFEDVISEFYKRNDELNNSSAPISSQLLSQRKPLGQQENLTALKTALFLKIKKRHLLLALLSLGLLGFGFLSFKWSYDGKERKYHDQLPRQKSKELLSVRSDLAVPSDLTFLNRPNLIDQINSYFQMSSQDIQTIAIIGIGGAGKTTLARQYARNHKSFVIWEMNAETKNSLTASFEDLAYALCQTEDERKILKALREIKDAHEKERSLLLLVKEKLRDQPDWLLIYDNVEAFSDIQKYFPYDAREWGNGKIIITSRDKNLESNRHINHIININELNKDEKRNLFFKIMSKTGNHKVFSEKIPSIELFLTSIPSFPLDVSVAAYYLKSTHVTYEEYLRRLNDSSNNFIKNQEFLLKETSSYYKTRYSIITLSLEQIIKANSNFEETLLFICLLDSQDIPRELLNKYKGDILIDDFIIHLKKYSLIKIGISSVGPTLSIHRSTQSIALNYIKNKLNLIENKKILDYIASCFENYISYTIKNNKFKKMKGLLRHGESFLNREYLFKNVSTVKIRGELGYAYYLLGDYQNAQHLLEKNQNLLNKNKYQDKIFFARTLTYLGIFYWYFGHFNKSFDLLKMSETVYEKSHTKDYWGLTKTLVYLGLVYPETNQAEKTKLPIEKALAIYKEHLPYDYKDKA
ncbi:MAG: hypothetical protein K0R24_2297, partial [Gammaproteobacteria bacterium]|nr:hypothetical protein [Gammaproteobacteria bacterium]